MRQKQEQNYYQRFIDALANSPQTQKKYIHELNDYLKWSNISDANHLIPGDLLDSPAAIRQVEDQIIEYIKFLTNSRKLGGLDLVLLLVLYRSLYGLLDRLFYLMLETFSYY